MNYLIDRLSYLESEDKNTSKILSSFVSKKQKPKIKNLDSSVKKILSLDKEVDLKKIDNSTKLEVKIKPLKSIETKKSKPVVWL